MAKTGLGAARRKIEGLSPAQYPSARNFPQAKLHTHHPAGEEIVYGSDPYIARAGGSLVINKPQHFGNFTNKYVYSPLKHGEVLKELQRLNPKIAATGSRKEKLHQFLSKGFGLEKAREQRQEVLTMLKLSDDINDFKRLHEKRFGPMDSQWSFFFPDTTH